jgi:hypothetical protein
MKNNAEDAMKEKRFLLWYENHNIWLQQTQKILPIASLMAIVGIGICLKLSGGGGGATALSSKIRVY